MNEKEEKKTEATEATEATKATEKKVDVEKEVELSQKALDREFESKIIDFEKRMKAKEEVSELKEKVDGEGEAVRELEEDDVGKEQEEVPRFESPKFESSYLSNIRKLNVNLVLWPDAKKMYVQVYEGGSLVPFKRFSPALTPKKPLPLSLPPAMLQVFLRDTILMFLKMYHEDSEKVFVSEKIPNLGSKKLSLHLRFTPKDGKFSFQIYPDVELSPVSYSGAGDSKDESMIFSRNKDEVLAICEKIFLSVLQGMKDDPSSVGVGPSFQRFIN